MEDSYHLLWWIKMFNVESMLPPVATPDLGARKFRFERWFQLNLYRGLHKAINDRSLKAHIVSSVNGSFLVRAFCRGEFCRREIETLTDAGAGAMPAKSVAFMHILLVLYITCADATTSAAYRHLMEIAKRYLSEYAEVWVYSTAALSDFTAFHEILVAAFCLDLWCRSTFLSRAGPFKLPASAACSDCDCEWDWEILNMAHFMRPSYRSYYGFRLQCIHTLSPLPIIMRKFTCKC